VVPATELSYDRFWAMDKSRQADHIWRHLFVERTPVSEACLGVLTSLRMLGLDPTRRTSPATGSGTRGEPRALRGSGDGHRNVDSIT